MFLIGLKKFGGTLDLSARLCNLEGLKALSKEPVLKEVTQPGKNGRNLLKMGQNSLSEVG